MTLRSHIEMNVIEHGQVEQYQQEREERARQDLIEELREVNMFLQINLLVCHVLEFTLTAQYILDVYSVGVSSASLRAVSFVDFWKEGRHLFSL